VVILDLDPAVGHEHVGIQLRHLLATFEPTLIMEAHDGLSARVAADAGFRALWASGLCMSTTLGLRDSDEASWTERLTLVARIVEAANLPVLVDGDSGYGNFSTARRFALQAEQIGAAGICIEDKRFPKTNSFVGDNHELAPVGEFCGKIRACRDAARNPAFVVVARTEALIANLGIDEALLRSEAYRLAGADAIFIHSRKPTVEEIVAFMTDWGDRLPVLIAPTTYPQTPMSMYADLGIAGVIWANQGMRAAVKAMRTVCRLLSTEGAGAVEGMIASLDDVFTLMDYAQLTLDEQRYGS